MVWDQVHFKSRVIQLRLPRWAWISIPYPASQNLVVFVIEMRFNALVPLRRFTRWVDSKQKQNNI